MMRGIAQTQERDRGTGGRLTLPVLTLLVVPLTLARCDATEQTPQAPQGNGGVKGKRPSKKDKLRAKSLTS